MSRLAGTLHAKADSVKRMLNRDDVSNRLVKKYLDEIRDYADAIDGRLDDE